VPDVKVKGLAELERALSQLPDKLERNVVRSALRMGAKQIEAEAKRLVPVKSGELRDSIRVSVRLIKGKPVATIKAGGRGKGGAFYAQMVEFGTSAHFIKASSAKSLFIAGLMRDGVNHPGATSKPFMRPALDSAAAQAVKAFAEQIRKRLTKAGVNVPDADAEG